MITAQQIARFGASLALAFAVGAVAVPTSTYATDEEVIVDETTAQGDISDQVVTDEVVADEQPEMPAQAINPSSAPFVINTVNGGIQQAANGTGYGLGAGAAASGNEGVGIGVGSTGAGSQIVGAGLGIPAGILSQP
jgi:hypothetical protein